MSNILKEIENILSELPDIEQELFYLLIVDGLNPTKAVDKVAFKHNLDVSTVWKGYYPQVKKQIASLNIKLYE